MRSPVTSQVGFDSMKRSDGLYTFMSTVEAIEKGVNDVAKFDAGQYSTF